MAFRKERDDIRNGGRLGADVYGAACNGMRGAIAKMRNGQDPNPDLQGILDRCYNADVGRHHILDAARRMYHKARYFVAATALLGVLTLAGFASTAYFGIKSSKAPAQPAPIVRTSPQSKYAPEAKLICNERAYYVQEYQKDGKTKQQLVVKKILPHLDETAFDVEQGALEGNEGLLAKLKEAENKDAEAGLLGLQACYTPEQCLQILEKAAGYDGIINKSDCKNIKGVGK